MLGRDEEVVRVVRRDGDKGDAGRGERRAERGEDPGQAEVERPLDAQRREIALGQDGGRAPAAASASARRRSPRRPAGVSMPARRTSLAAAAGGSLRSS
jgi:hypothetical protein